MRETGKSIKSIIPTARYLKNFLHNLPATFFHIFSQQSGDTCWLGEILTEGVENRPNDTSKPIRLADFESVYRLAPKVLPNNNIKQ